MDSTSSLPRQIPWQTASSVNKLVAMTSWNPDNRQKWRQALSEKFESNFKGAFMSVCVHYFERLQLFYDTQTRHKFTIADMLILLLKFTPATCGKLSWFVELFLSLPEYCLDDPAMLLRTRTEQHLQPLRAALKTLICQNLAVDEDAPHENFTEALEMAFGMPYIAPKYHENQYMSDSITRLFHEGFVCAPVVGPMGVGKTRDLAQYCMEHGIYLVHTCFSPINVFSFPRQSGTASVVSRFFFRDVSLMAAMFEVLLTAQLAFVRLARAAKIPPRRLFEMQIQALYCKFQKALDGLYFELLADPRLADGSEQVLRRGIPDFEKECKKLLDEYGSTQGPDYTSDMKLKTIICFDDITHLMNVSKAFDGEDFRKASEVLREVVQRVLPADAFFVLVDKDPLVATLFPAVPSNRPGAKIVCKLETEAICEIQTKDLMVEVCRQEFSDASFATRSMILYGRPLWGSLLLAGLTTAEIIAFARGRLFNSLMQAFDVRNKALMALSYRVPLVFMGDESLRPMVTEGMHWVARADPLRGILETCAPVEPLLHHIMRAEGLGHPLDLVLHPTEPMHMVASPAQGVALHALATMVIAVADDIMYQTRSGSEDTNFAPINVMDFLEAIYENVSLENDPLSAMTGTISVSRVIQFARCPTKRDLADLYAAGCAAMLPAWAGSGAIIVPVRGLELGDYDYPGMRYLLLQASAEYRAADMAQRVPADGHVAECELMRRLVVATQATLAELQGVAFAGLVVDFYGRTFMEQKDVHAWTPVGVECAVIVMSGLDSLQYVLECTPQVSDRKGITLGWLVGEVLAALAVRKSVHSDKLAGVFRQDEMLPPN